MNPSIAKFFDGLPSMTNISPSEDAVNIKSPFSENLSTHTHISDVQCILQKL